MSVTIVNYSSYYIINVFSKPNVRDWKLSREIKLLFDPTH